MNSKQITLKATMLGLPYETTEMPMQVTLSNHVEISSRICYLMGSLLGKMHYTDSTVGEIYIDTDDLSITEQKYLGKLLIGSQQLFCERLGNNFKCITYVNPCRLKLQI